MAIKESFRWEEFMAGIKIYTIDSKKMTKKGLQGWNAEQEHSLVPFIVAVNAS